MKTLTAWIGHPHLSIIDNATGFDKKIAWDLAVISDLLGIPVSREREQKFLIEMPDLATLEKAHPVKSHMVQTYLPNERTMDRRVRQRGGRGGLHFLLR